MTTTNITPDKNLYISKAYSNENFSNSQYLYAGRYTSAADIYRSLIKFNVSYANNIIPKIVTIKSAIMQLNIYRNEIPSGNINLSVYRLLQNFNESTVTWDTQPLFHTIADGITSVPAGFFGTVYVDLTNLVTSWHDTSIINNGALIAGNESMNSILGFLGTNYPDSTKWPKLVINYTNGIQTIYPTETVSVPSSGTAFSTPINLGDTRKEIFFLTKVPSGATVNLYAQISPDGVNYFWGNSSVYNEYSFSVELNQPAKSARVMVESSYGSATTVEVTPIIWEN